jgi:diphthine-ammonia ligase
VFLKKTTHILDPPKSLPVFGDLLCEFQSSDVDSPRQPSTINMGNLKIVALISGGKDSFFSLLHCIANGHDVVALANLHPASPAEGAAIEDTDSFMYQTIGHAVIPLYEKALGVPLYRQEIAGSAVNQSKSYGPTPNEAEKADETESLVPLLRKVMAAHPEVNAVSTGAILSDYQRTRVESVALRLGLTPLSYLWQYPHLPPGTQTSLLEDMAAVGQDARIIKVASGGMDDSFLWQNVADFRTKNRLVKAAQRFSTDGDGAALGEGGEYETLAIAGPAPLWKARIVVGEGDRAVLPGEAGSASVKINKAEIAPLEVTDAQQVRTPDLLDERFAALLERMNKLSAEEDHTLSNSPPSQDEKPRSGDVLIESLTAPGDNASEQTEAIMRQLDTKLREAGLGFSDIAYTSIILRSMADFASVNAAYGKCFQHPSPPARITLSCAGVLPQDALVTISATGVAPTSSKARKGLHVQSRSYWAPANIGPYSQAITVPAATRDGNEREIVYVAGQIPLEPASMELYSPHGHDTAETFVQQGVLALQHLYRIGAAVSVRRWSNVIAFITSPSAEEAASRANVARRVWQEFHQPSGRESTEEDEDEDEAFDVWDQQRGAGRGAWQTYEADEKDDSARHEQSTPPIYVIEVDSLPRGASIEWVAYGVTGNGQEDVVIPHLSHLLHMFKSCLR